MYCEKCGAKFRIPENGKRAVLVSSSKYDSNKTIEPQRPHVIPIGDEVTVPGLRNRLSSGMPTPPPPGKINHSEQKMQNIRNGYQPGSLIMKRYKVIAELGRGGMGVVYQCYDTTAGINVALKVLPPELSHDVVEMEKIRTNFQLVHKLHHPNIASYNNLEKDCANGNYYLIMEYCEGEDLRHWLSCQRKSGALKHKKILSVIKQVAAALDYAHKQKVIHRDIKPGNIIINSRGEIKVLDFGLAAQIHNSMTKISMAYHGTSGTRSYMAPEQWCGKAQGAAADQYALAVMTYEMFAGRLPFENSDSTVLREAVLNDTAENIPNISPAMQSAIEKAMSKDPHMRFANCSQFFSALRSNMIYLKSEIPLPPQSSIPFFSVKQKKMQEIKKYVAVILVEFFSLILYFNNPDTHLYIALFWGGLSWLAVFIIQGEIDISFRDLLKNFLLISAVHFFIVLSLSKYEFVLSLLVVPMSVFADFILAVVVWNLYFLMAKFIKFIKRI